MRPCVLKEFHCETTRALGHGSGFSFFLPASGTPELGVALRQAISQYVEGLGFHPKYGILITNALKTVSEELPGCVLCRCLPHQWRADTAEWSVAQCIRAPWGLGAVRSTAGSRYHCCMDLKPPTPSAPSVRPEPSEWKAGAPGHLGSQRWPCCICPLSVSLDLTRKAWLLN